MIMLEGSKRSDYPQCKKFFVNIVWRATQRGSSQYFKGNIESRNTPRDKDLFGHIETIIISFREERHPNFTKKMAS